MTGFPDIPNSYVVGLTFPPATRTANGDGTGIDLTSSEGPVTAVLGLGAASGTSATLDVKLQESDDNSTYTDISGATFSQLTDTSDNTVLAIATWNRKKRYVRASATIAGTSPSFLFGVTVHSPKKSY